MIRECAPAKINLYLHVGGVREDGLHELASLFVFADDGDWLTLEPADDLTLEITGPFAAPLREFPLADNLILQAAQALRDKLSIKAGASIRLEKNLPIAAGIGGGSADAAAALRGLLKLWQAELAQEDLTALAFSLGADIPACLVQYPVWVDGAGEIFVRGPELPAMSICLINPGVPTPTGPIFRAYDEAHPNPPAPQHVQYKEGQGGDNQWREVDGTAFLETLSRETRNDLQAPAVSLVPVIDDVLAFLNAQDGCGLARMSGSGATCFGLFLDHEEATASAEAALENSWWAMSGRVER